MAMATSKIYELYGLKQYFPLRESEIHRASPELQLHYLILYQKVQGEADWLEKYSESMVAKEPRSLLTPLHLCAIIGDRKTAETLLRNPKVSVAEQDIRKWTPLHHAALRQDPEMMDMLLGADKAKNCDAAVLKNGNNGSYEELRRLAFPVEVDPNIEIFNYRSVSGEIVGGKAAKFQEMTGAKFVRQMCASPAFFMEEWAEPTKTVESDKEQAELLREAYQKYQQDPSLLYLDKSKVGYGVFALQSIPVDTIVVDYLGEAPYVSGSLYAVDLCDGARKRNLGPMVNDGFPNCVDIPMSHVCGFPLMRVLRTTRPVERGEEILWNYGISHPVKEGIYLNLAGPRAEQWFIDRHLMDRYLDMGEVMKNIMTRGEGLKFRRHLTYFHYLLTTPSYQVLLLLKRIVDVDHLYTLIQQSHFVRREGELVSRQEVEKNLFITKRIFRFCQSFGNPKENEKNLVTLVEELLAIFKASSVVKFLHICFMEDPCLPPVVEIIKGNKKFKANVLRMVKELENSK